ncbi:MAG TPA: GreA/GreB family elongation factor [Thermoanaerobaculia bacterium]|nr:GreA/GreB family elongation factor [Thermoanaerobaculia bacterium]
MQFVQDAAKLITEKKFDEVESRWMAEMESDPTRTGLFLEVAKNLRKAEERGRADALLELLADALLEKKAWPERLTVLRELARLSRKPDKLRIPLEEALRKALGDRPSFDKVAAAVGLSDDKDIADKVEKMALWLTYEEGEYFFMAGRGAGVVTELNPVLGICRIDFDQQKRVSVPLGAAPKNLIPLPPGHILRDRFERPDELEKEVIASPAEAFARLLKSFGRAMAVSEVKGSMSGIVPDSKWSSWWTAARKHPQIVMSGSGARATYAWSTTEGGAETAIRRRFDQADVRGKLDLARKESSRSREINAYFSEELIRQAERLSSSDPALAWEILAILDKLPGEVRTSLDRDQLLTGAMAGRVISGISDRTLRERALEVVREKHPDWAKVYGETFFLDDDPRILTLVMDALGGGAPEIRDRLVDETLRHPRRHPRAFFWYCRMASEAETLPEKANFNLLFQMIESIGWDEFSPVRARMKDFFDRGGLAVRIIMKGENEDSARKLLGSLERFGGVEEYRRDLLRDAMYLAYPELRAPQVEPIFATPDALAAKREELDRMKNVDLPATLTAIQVAREMGDLRENFEYKAARQRQEYLSARVAELSSDLTRVKVIDPVTVDTSEIRIGTRVRLRNGDVQREVTILGPWESDPEHGIYSNQSDAAMALLGHRTDEVVTFMGNDYVVEGIEAWRK